jgi:hypothetical protein
VIHGGRPLPAHEQCPQPTGWGQHRLGVLAENRLAVLLALDVLNRLIELALELLDAIPDAR